MKLLLGVLFAVTLTGGDPLQTALSRLDANAASFKSAKAKITYTTHNVAVDLDTTQTGSILLKRPAPRELRALIDFTGADAHTLMLQGQTAQLYYPKINTVQEYEIGKNRDLFEQVFLLGFGGSGKELAAAYDVTLLGADEVRNGEKTTHLQLIPKSKQVSQYLRKVELWLSNSTGYPVQQKGYQPSGDSTLLAYADLIINSNIPDSALKLKPRKGFQKVYPQK
ncbi:MAG: outer membrane lipoprotein carrier protein LolA [Acidobacteriota bacterium]|nr:outer membrane lipoprotein carrier protein LolA [Acidobacteriota bacterium]